MKSIARRVFGLVAPLVGLAGATVCMAEPLTTDAATLSLYSFDRAEETKVAGLNGGSADLSSGVTLVEGKYGQGLRFNGLDGKAQLRFPRMLRIGGNESCTIETWVRVTKAGATQPIYSMPPFFELEVRNGSGAVSFNITSVDGGKAVRCTGKKNIVDGAWHHVAGIRDAAKKTVKVYIDGQLDVEVDDTTSGLGLIIGETAFLGSNAGGSETFGGVIDELRISNVARPMKQIATERPPEGRPLTLENQQVRFIFSVSGSSVSLKSLVDKQSGVEFVDQATVGENLWQAQMRSADREILALNEKLGKLTVQDTKHGGGKGLSFKWDALPVASKAAAASVEVTVDLADDSRMADWRINVDNKSADYGLWTAVFPRVTNFAKLADDGTDVIAIPGGNGGGAGEGQAYPDPFKTMEGHTFLRTYPCYHQSMQFNTYYNAKAGLYLATYDEKMNLKAFLLKPQSASVGQRPTVLYETHLYPANAGMPGVGIAQNYPHYFGTFVGDWYDASKIYRQWALKQSWAAAGPLEQRNDISPFIKDGAYWMVGTFEWEPSDKPLLREKFRQMPYDDAVKNARVLDVEKSIQLAKRASDYFGFPLLLWTNEWFDGGGDLAPPRYIHQRKLPEYMKRVHDELKDVYVTGHMQMKRTSVQLPEFKQNAEWQAAIEGKSDGTKHWEPLGAMAEDHKGHEDQHAYPCWATDFWKTFWTNKSKSIVSETGLDGFHVDELGSAMNFELQCFDPSHGHPTGGGTLYADTRRHNIDLLRKSARTVKPTFAIHHEALSEMFLDRVDLAEVDTAPSNKNVPMWEAVYHDYSFVMGRRIHPWMDRRTFHLDDKEKFGDNEIDQFNASFAQTFIWGNQPGWTRLDIVEYSPKVAELIKRYMQVRYLNMKYLNTGEFIRHVNLKTPQEMIKTVWTTCDTPEHILPAVMNSVWKASDGSIGVVLANTTGVPRKIHYSYDLAENGGKVGKWKVLRTDGPQPAEVGIIDGDTFERTDEVPARSVIVLSFVPVK